MTKWACLRLHQSDDKINFVVRFFDEWLSAYLECFFKYWLDRVVLRMDLKSTRTISYAFNLKLYMA